MVVNLQMTPRSQSFNTVDQINNMAQFFQGVLSAQSEKCLEILKYYILPLATSLQKELSVFLASFTPLSVFISWLFPVATYTWSRMQSFQKRITTVIIIAFFFF